MKIILTLIILILSIGCATRNIEYDRNKILKKYSSDYNIFVDNQEIDFEKIYLNKYNIAYVKIDNQNKKVNIKQLKTVELIEVKKIYLDSINKLHEYTDEKKLELLIVINGLPLKDSSFKIDPKAILSLRILSQNELNNIYGERPFDGGIIITTK
jgi:hypothetical protein